MASRSIFDPFTGQLEDFVRDNQAEIEAVEIEIGSVVYEPLVKLAGESLGQARSIHCVDECFKRAEATFSDIASRLGLDSWFSLLRRFPRQAGFSEGWEHYATIGLVRYAASDRDTTVSKVTGEQEYSVTLAYTEDDLLDAFRLAFLAKTLTQIAGTRRWIGKGAHLQPAVSKPLHLEIPDEVEESVKEYEHRRPQLCLLQDEGLLIYQPKTKVDLPLVVLRKLPANYLYVPGRDISLLCHYFPFVIDSAPIQKQLRAYEDAIEDLFSLTSDDIIHFFSAVATQILRSLPTIDDVGDKLIILAADDGSADYNHRLGFLFRLCHLGSLRFPREALVRRLAEVRSPWATDATSATEAIERFLAAFLVCSDEDRNDIDLATLRPFPFVYSSASGEVYVDLIGSLDFFAWIIERAKEWYSTQHGDHFTLALKKWIESKTAAKVVGWKMVVRNSTGKDCEVDLLVLHSKTLFAIECKAFAKSRAFFCGDPEAVRQRSGRVKLSTDQAQVAASAVRDAVARRDSSIPAAANVEWLVCTPTQEYLRPPARYGFVIGNVPRVCTPEELLVVLAERTESSQGNSQVGAG
ncbi:hypothetical protein [Desulforegula conservatrix]|uniref:hypothetical protein n=1 Tax=Desulforegula conservatrix TaxID=153026 RepID=UPI0004255876|nr:hypothetical protein [Desulforegula conservatrix]